jgi:hypothetical protein
MIEFSHKAAGNDEDDLSIAVIPINQQVQISKMPLEAHLQVP